MGTASSVSQKKAKPRIKPSEIDLAKLEGSLYPKLMISKLRKDRLPKKLRKKLCTGHIIQVDGAEDSSDEDDEDNDDDDDDDIDPDGEDEDEGAEEEPLGSDDDISDEDASELYETDNVVVCQYNKISRTRNKWKFNLKDGIMSLNGKDYVFSSANGEAEWR